MVETADGVDSPHHRGEYRVLDGVANAVRALNDLSLAVVVVSNQPGIAKGKSTSEELWEMTDYLRAELSRVGGVIDAVYYCLHHPQAVLPEYRVACDCRKPMPGLLHLAAQELGIDLTRSYMVGDQPTDILAGKAAGCATILVPAHHGLVDPPAETDYICSGLPDAARLIGRLALGNHQLSALGGS